MMAPVLQNIDERVSHFARCAEGPCVIATSPDASPPPEGPIDSFGEPDDESLYPSRERPSPVRLNNEMNVVGLYGEVEDADSVPRAPGEAAPERQEQVITAQRGEVGASAERHVRRMPWHVIRPRTVGNADLPARGLPAGAGSAAAPGGRAELELK